MRVRKNPYDISITSFLGTVNIESLYSIAAPEAPEDMNQVVESRIFALIKPGNERACVVLRAEGYSFEAIGDVLGLEQHQVKYIFESLRKRILSKFDKRSLYYPRYEQK